MDEVSAAMISDMKKRIAIRPPRDILEKMNGSVSKTRPGPAWGLSPLANTAGIMAHPAIRAKMRSETAMEAEERIRLSFRLTYEA